MENNLSLFAEDIKKTFILHIPHSSTHIPNLERFNMNLLKSELIYSTDIDTDKIFDVDGVEKHIAQFSRLFCDVERFVENEPMDKFGRGMYYTKSIDNKSIRKFGKFDYKRVLNDYYQPHHSEFQSKVENILNDNTVVRIIDCHSFNENKLPFELDSIRPDICLGVDEYHTPNYLLDYIKYIFESNGLTVVINKPYSGTIVPLKYYRNNKNVESIMIEINKKLYVENDRVVIPEKVVELNNIIKSIFEF